MLNLVEASLHVGHELTRIGASQTKHEAFYRFTVAIRSDSTVPCQRAQLDTGNVLDPDRNPNVRAGVA